MCPGMQPRIPTATASLRLFRVPRPPVSAGRPAAVLHTPRRHGCRNPPKLLAPPWPKRSPRATRPVQLPRVVRLPPRPCVEENGHRCRYEQQHALAGLARGPAAVSGVSYFPPARRACGPHRQPVCAPVAVHTGRFRRKLVADRVSAPRGRGADRRATGMPHTMLQTLLPEQYPRGLCPSAHLCG